jgi:Zn finger protein HypA/HybF involved in hydrogenase expression
MARTLTKDDFVEKAIIKHGDNYNYSKVEYITTKQKVEIVCPNHGSFLQTPANHLKGQGCPDCGRIARATSQRYSSKEFINSVRKIHGNTYDYSEVDYVNSQTKVKIICHVHGHFYMKPNSHFNGQGCPKCGRISANENIALDYSVFLERAEKVHGNRYEYVEETYNTYTSRMRIFCSEHGFFEQTPHSHISMKTGCPLCGNRSAGLSNQKGWEVVRDMFISVHGDRYKYDSNTYRDVSHKMRIECSIHGWFEQKPYQHYSDHGCKKCGSEENAERKKITFSDFIEKSKVIHGKKCSYEKAEYVDIFTPIHITCSKHGEFFQTPRNHYRGSGCPKCNSSKGEEKIRNILSDLSVEFIEQKTFDDLVHKNYLRCDFYLPNHNTVIEFNGIQHYEPISVFGGINGLKENQTRDIIKYNFLEKNKIDLIIVRYDNEDIKNYLINKLNFANRTCKS